MKLRTLAVRLRLICKSIHSLLVSSVFGSEVVLHGSSAANWGLASLAENQKHGKLCLLSMKKLN